VKKSIYVYLADLAGVPRPLKNKLAVFSRQKSSATADLV